MDIVKLKTKNYEKSEPRKFSQSNKNSNHITFEVSKKNHKSINIYYAKKCLYNRNIGNANVIKYINYVNILNKIQEGHHPTYNCPCP